MICLGPLSSSDGAFCPIACHTSQVVALCMIDKTIKVGHAAVVQAEIDVCHVKAFMFSLEGFHVSPTFFRGFMSSLMGFHVFPIRARGQRNPSTTKSLLTSRCPRTDVELRRQGLIPWYLVARCIKLTSRRFHTQRTRRARIGAATSKQTQHCFTSKSGNHGTENTCCLVAREQLCVEGELPHSHGTQWQL